MQKKVIFGITILAFLSACSTNSTTEKNVGYYLDSAVEGIKYACGNHQGTTNSEGKFIFEQEKKCVFSIGDIVLRQIDADYFKESDENAINIVEENSTTAAFLQSIDLDGDSSNGIQISSDTVNVLKEMQVVKVPDHIELGTLIEKLNNDIQNFNGHVVSEADAMKHVAETQRRVREDSLDDSGKFLDDLVSGHLIFKNFNDEIVPVPAHAWIRITPEDILHVNANHDTDGNWPGVNCVIDNDGNFGDECYIHIDETEIRKYFTTDISGNYEVAIYNERYENTHFDKNDRSYTGGTYKYNGWSNAVINIP